MQNDLLTAPAEAAPFEVPPIQEPHEAPAFHVVDEKTANWVLGKLANCDAETARIKEWSAEELARTAKEKDSLMARFGGELEAFAADALTGAKTKTLKLPNGSLSFRAQPDKLEVVDEDAAINWAKSNFPIARMDTLTVDLGAIYPDKLRALYSLLDECGVDFADCVSSKLFKTPLNDYFKATGEVPPGCVHKPAEEKFYVK